MARINERRKNLHILFNFCIGLLCGWLIGESAREAEYAYTVVATVILFLYLLQQICLIYL